MFCRGTEIGIDNNEISLISSEIMVLELKVKWRSGFGPVTKHCTWFLAGKGYPSNQCDYLLSHLLTFILCYFPLSTRLLVLELQQFLYHIFLRGTGKANEKKLGQSFWRDKQTLSGKQLLRVCLLRLSVCEWKGDLYATCWALTHLVQAAVRPNCQSH